jgi:asparagine synthetase B (glutamine-hydrolysing)
MAELSGIVKGKKLVSEKKWIRHIETLNAGVGAEIKNKRSAIKLIKEKLMKAVEKRSFGKFGILFSGGVDSATIALICKLLGKTFCCYAVGLKGSKDLEASVDLAKKLRLRLVKKELSFSEVEMLLKKAAKTIPLRDVVTVEVAAVELAAISLAKRHGDKILFSGLGSEEIFAGYHRHLQSDDANKECWNGLKLMWQRDFLRDYALSASEKVSLLTPFLDNDLILAAMRVPSKWKISSLEKKIILREVSASLGMPSQYAFRKKYAAQYGSSLDKAVEKLSKQNGFQRKHEYVASISK